MRSVFLVVDRREDRAAVSDETLRDLERQARTDPESRRALTRERFRARRGFVVAWEGVCEDAVTFLLMRGSMKKPRCTRALAALDLADAFTLMRTICVGKSGKDVPGRGFDLIDLETGQSVCGCWPRATEVTSISLEPPPRSPVRRRDHSSNCPCWDCTTGGATVSLDNCRRCRGTGRVAEAGSNGDRENCPDCGGTGDAPLLDRRIFPTRPATPQPIRPARIREALTREINDTHDRAPVDGCDACGEPSGMLNRAGLCPSCAHRERP